MINDILKHIRAWMDLPARYADGRWFLREPEVATEIIVPTACTAFIWTAVRETGNQTVMDEWSLWPVWVRKNGEWAIIHRCIRCGKLSSNRTAADDNPMKLMALAMRPFGSNAISRETIRRMTASMEGKD